MKGNNNCSGYRNPRNIKVMTVLVGKMQLWVLRALLSPAATARQPACRISQGGMVCLLGGRLDPVLLVLGSPFNFIHVNSLLKHHSKSAFLLLLPWIILSAQGLSFLWVIPLGMLMACSFSDLDYEMALFKSTPVFPKAWTEVGARNIAGHEAWLWAR